MALLRLLIGGSAIYVYRHLSPQGSPFCRLRNDPNPKKSVEKNYQTDREFTSPKLKSQDSVVLAIRGCERPFEDRPQDGAEVEIGDPQTEKIESQEGGGLPPPRACGGN